MVVVISFANFEHLESMRHRKFLSTTKSSGNLRPESSAPPRCRFSSAASLSILSAARHATPAGGRLERLDVVALVRGNQRPLMFRMARLPTASLLRLLPLPHGLSVRMLRARRQRRVLRGFARSLTPQELQLCLRLCQSRQQRTNDRLRFRRLSGNQFFRDNQVHASCCDMKPMPCKS